MASSASTSDSFPASTFDANQSTQSQRCSSIPDKVLASTTHGGSCSWGTSAKIRSTLVGPRDDEHVAGLVAEPIPLLDQRIKRDGPALDFRASAAKSWVETRKSQSE